MNWIVWRNVVIFFMWTPAVTFWFKEIRLLSTILLILTEAVDKDMNNQCSPAVTQRLLTPGSDNLTEGQ